MDNPACLSQFSESEAALTIIIPLNCCAIHFTRGEAKQNVKSTLRLLRLAVDITI